MKSIFSNFSMNRRLAAVGACALMASALPVAAHASTLTFEDVGIGNLTASTAQIDGSTAALSYTITDSNGVFTPSIKVVETLGGKPFYTTSHGSQSGTSGSFEIGYTFNLLKSEPLKFAAPAPGTTLELVAGIPTTTSLGKEIGTPDTLSFAGLAPGKYTLLFSGIVTGTTSYTTGKISAVPLPGALVMFGSALVGLTALGARRRGFGLSA